MEEFKEYRLEFEAVELFNLTKILTKEYSSHDYFLNNVMVEGFKDIGRRGKIVFIIRAKPFI